METESIIMSLMRVLFPGEIANHFEVKKVDEHSDRVEIRLEELPELCPKEMTDQKEIVLDGFCNAIELQTFALKGKPTYLKVYRRRWKYKGENQHFTNTYNLNPEGVKATSDFATFLKDALGYTPGQYVDLISGGMR